MQALYVRFLRKARGRIRCGFDCAQKHRVIRDGVKIQRLSKPDLEACGVGNGVTFRVAISIIRGRNSAKGIGVEGIIGMHVQVAKVRIAQGIVVRLSDDRP